MKKCFLPLILACLLLLCTGCFALSLAAREDNVLAEVAGQDVHILFDENTTLSGTVEADHGVYSFQYDENDDLTIQYPDGKVFTWKAMQGDWPYAETETDLGFLPGADLAASLDLASGVENKRTPAPEPSSGVPPIVSVVIIALGLWFLISPAGVWRTIIQSFREGAEPGTHTFRVFRIVGAGVAIVGGLLLFL